jgi:pyruvate kinase
VRDDGADHRPGGGEPLLRAAAVGAGASTREAIAHAACSIAARGGRARAGRVHGERRSAAPDLEGAPGVPIVAFASDEANLRPLALYWGVVPGCSRCPQIPDVDTLVAKVVETLLEQRWSRAATGW